MIPFQLGVITDEISADFERALDVMADYCLRQVEIRELWGKNVLKLTADELHAAKDAVRRRGMEVCSIASPFYKCSMADGDGGERAGAERKLHGAAEAGLEAQMAILRRAFELAHFFGASIVRVFAFWREGSLNPEVYQAIRTAFKEPVRLAEREGLILGLENEHACMLGTGTETAPLVREMNSPNLRCVWDPGNAFQLDERPYPDGYAAVRDLLCHVHVKDARRVAQPDGKLNRPWTAMGSGEIDYAGQFQALVQDGYSGVVSLETHYRNAAGDREASSRECLEGIQRLLDRVC